VRLTCWRFVCVLGSGGEFNYKGCTQKREQECGGGGGGVEVKEESLAAWSGVSLIYHVVRRGLCRTADVF
jgi:hypothetical protein